jgi:hypothetical protein
VHLSRFHETVNAHVPCSVTNNGKHEISGIFGNTRRVKRDWRGSKSSDKGEIKIKGEFVWRVEGNLG